MKLIIAMLLTGLCMSGFGGFIFAIMLLTVVGVIDIRHNQTMVEVRIKRLIDDIESACEGTKITVVKK